MKKRLRSVAEKLEATGFNMPTIKTGDLSQEDVAGGLIKCA